MTPIPKFKGNKRKVVSDDFRCITINVMASKIFEHAITHCFGNLFSSDRQFGFKKGSGCNRALHSVRSVVNFMIKRGCTVNLGLIDVKKAFDIE